MGVKKPSIDYQIIEAVFKLKPWKGKPSNYICTYSSWIPIEIFIKETIEIISLDKRFKRRTILSVTISYPINVNRTILSVTISYPINVKL